MQLDYTFANKQTHKQTLGAKQSGSNAVQPSACSHLQLPALSCETSTDMAISMNLSSLALSSANQSSPTMHTINLHLKHLALD